MSEFLSKVSLLTVGSISSLYVGSGQEANPHLPEASPFEVACPAVYAVEAERFRAGYRLSSIIICRDQTERLPTDGERFVFRFDSPPTAATLFRIPR